MTTDPIPEPEAEATLPAVEPEPPVAEEVVADPPLPEEAEPPAGDAPAQAEPPVPAADAETAAALRGIEQGLEEAVRLLDRQTGLADRLHAENQRLREGELRNALLPMVRDLLHLHDDLGRLLEAAAEDASAGDLRIVREALTETLRRNGIDQTSPEIGSAFDPKLHSTAGVVPTADHAQHRTIAEVVRPGYRWDDGTRIRVAEVRVHKHTPAPEAASPEPVETQGSN